MGRCDQTRTGSEAGEGKTLCRLATGGIYVALELAEQAYEAHELPYEPELSNMSRYDPRRFTWVYDETGEADDCVKVRDDKTGRLAVVREY